MLELSIVEVARIARMYIDGDAVETLLLDKTGHVDYDFEQFTAVKATLTKAERINGELGLAAVIWARRAGEPGCAEPLVCASQLPVEGWLAVRINGPMQKAFQGAENAVLERDTSTSHYFPIYNSDHEIAGVLELLSSKNDRNDI